MTLSINQLLFCVLGLPQDCGTLPHFSYQGFTTRHLGTIRHIIRHLILLNGIRTSRIISELPRRTQTQRHTSASLDNRLLTRLRVTIVTRFKGIRRRVVHALQCIISGTRDIRTLTRRVTLIHMFYRRIVMMILTRSRSQSSNLLRKDHHTSNRRIICLLNTLGSKHKHGSVTRPPSHSQMNLKRQQTKSHPLPRAKRHDGVNINTQHMSSILMRLINSGVSVVLFNGTHGRLRLIPNRRLTTKIQKITRSRHLQILTRNVLRCLKIGNGFQQHRQRVG